MARQSPETAKKVLQKLPKMASKRSWKQRKEALTERNGVEPIFLGGSTHGGILWELILESRESPKGEILGPVGEDKVDSLFSFIFHAI